MMKCTNEHIYAPQRMNCITGHISINISVYVHGVQRTNLIILVTPDISCSATINRKYSTCTQEILLRDCHEICFMIFRG